MKDTLNLKVTFGNVGILLSCSIESFIFKWDLVKGSYISSALPLGRDSHRSMSSYS